MTRTRLAGAVVAVLAACAVGVGCSSDGGTSSTPSPDVEINISDVLGERSNRANDPDISAEFLALFDLNAADDQLANGVVDSVEFALPDRNELSGAQWQLTTLFSYELGDEACGGNGVEAPCAVVGWRALRRGNIVADSYAVIAGVPGERQLSGVHFCELVVAAGGTCS